MLINLNDCVACLLLMVTLKMDLYRKPMPPSPILSGRVYELVADRCQVFHCFGVLVSRAKSSLGDCHEINVGISDMVSENVCFMSQTTVENCIGGHVNVLLDYKKT